VASRRQGRGDRCRVIPKCANHKEGATIAVSTPGQASGRNDAKKKITDEGGKGDRFAAALHRKKALFLTSLTRLGGKFVVVI